MLDIFLQRLRQKKRTVPFPAALPALPPRFRGRPCIDAARCSGASGRSCTLCRDVCPTGALALEDRSPALDMGLCTFCGACALACPHEALVFTTDWRLASSDRAALIVRPAAWPAACVPDAAGQAASVVRQSLPTRPERGFFLPPLPITPSTAAGGAFRNSFRLRQVTAAGCGACEADLNVLSTVVFDLGRFGMDFVASPRHADGLALTGPVPRNMLEALLKCRNAMAAPNLILAIGACAISGGLFRSAPDASSGQRAEGASPHVQADLFIPGCPPHPYTALDGLLRCIGRTAPAPLPPYTPAR